MVGDKTRGADHLGLPEPLRAGDRQRVGIEQRPVGIERPGVGLTLSDPFDEDLADSGGALHRAGFAPVKLEQDRPVAVSQHPEERALLGDEGRHRRNAGACGVERIRRRAAQGAAHDSEWWEWVRPELGRVHPDSGPPRSRLRLRARARRHEKGRGSATRRLWSTLLWVSRLGPAQVRDRVRVRDGEVLRTPARSAPIRPGACEGEWAPSATRRTECHALARIPPPTSPMSGSPPTTQPWSCFAVWRDSCPDSRAVTATSRTRCGAPQPRSFDTLRRVRTVRIRPTRQRGSSWPRAKSESATRASRWLRPSPSGLPARSRSCVRTRTGSPQC